MQPLHLRDKYVSKIKCFRCGEFGHYATQCPLRKRDKYEKHNMKVASMNIKEDEFIMATQASLGGRWGVLEL